MTTEDGICVQCPIYENAVDNYTTCKRPNCSKNQIIREDATCEDCEMYTIPNDNQTKCIVDPQMIASNMSLKQENQLLKSEIAQATKDRDFEKNRADELHTQLLTQ